MYPLTAAQKGALSEAIEAAFAIPFIDDIEDFIWEAIFASVKGIPLVDPLTETRSKKLFDLVDPATHTGWSAKALQWNNTSTEFELVIQRADIFKKAEDLGHAGGLDKNSPPATLGKALLKHWNLKVEQDAYEQGVTSMRECILLKSPDRKHYVYFEEDLHIYEEADLGWAWSDATKTGLQGRLRANNNCVFRWYPNQKQLFHRYTLPAGSYRFSINPKRAKMATVIKTLKGLV